jgi:CRISPR type I-E-associated protein CasB/Cse2
MTTSTPSLTTTQRAARYLESVHRKIEHDNAAKATLKRALTGEPRHLRAVYPILLSELDKAGVNYHQDEWIFVACLFAYYPQSLDLARPQNFGYAARGLAGEGTSGGADRRFRVLLDTSLDNLRSPLSALVRLLKSKSIAIHYPQLIADLSSWEHPDQYIQDNWARAFWGAPPKSAAAEPAAETE